MNKYFKPKSITWWSGLIIALIPLIKLFGIEVPENLPEILGGIALIGLRGAVKPNN